MHKRGARGAAANRNAVIMDAVPATVVHHEARGDGYEDRREPGAEGEKGLRISGGERSFAKSISRNGSGKLRFDRFVSLSFFFFDEF